MSKTIAIIDDETVHIDFYCKALESIGYDVTHFKSPASCLTLLQGQKRFDLYVTDLMMPSRGAYGNDETEDGLLTGLLLTRDIRALDAERPICILTNVNIDAVLSRVRAAISELPNVFVLRKVKYPPTELGLAVRAVLEDGQTFGKRKSILQRLWGSLLLQPNLSGIGIDLKKLADEP